MTWLDWVKLANIVTNVLVIACFVDDWMRKRRPPWTELDQLHKLASLQERNNNRIDEELTQLYSRVQDVEARFSSSPYRGATHLRSTDR